MTLADSYTGSGKYSYKGKTYLLLKYCKIKDNRYTLLNLVKNILGIKRSWREGVVYISLDSDVISEYYVRDRKEFEKRFKKLT